MKDYFSQIKYYLLLAVLFVFPFFFLPFTQEFFITNKLYLLGSLALSLILVSALEFAFTKKISWQKTPFDGGLILLLLTIGLSVVIVSPNKIQAILNPNYGLLALVSLFILYFYLVRTSENKSVCITPLQTLFASSALLSLITIVFFFNPFKQINLVGDLAVLKVVGFTPLGSQLDLAVFLGFFTIMGIMRILKPETSSKNALTLDFLFSTLNLTALLLTIYFILKSTNPLLLPPFRLTWYAAVEILKNPLTAFFGVGVDNYSSIFTRVKDFTYNQSPLWQTPSFVVGRSTLLHIMTETGLLGLLAFSLILAGLIREVRKLEINQYNNNLFLAACYLFLVVLVLPPSLPLLFLFFVTLALVGKKAMHEAPGETHAYHKKPLDLSEILPAYFGVIIVGLVIVGASSYYLYRYYSAEYYFKKSLDGLIRNSAMELYNNQRNAIIQNPNIERFHINFSQTNLLIANNIASKKREEITAQDTQTISQAIQTAIAEGKAALTLNPQKSTNWANLAEIYRNILNAVQGADAWTISAYQRAIMIDPQNPVYRLNLGGIYYAYNNFDEAGKLFEQAVITKPDWPNAYYNLAWADFQKGSYVRAVNEMQNVLNLLDPRAAKADYDKAAKDLEEFRKKLPPEKAATEGTSASKPTELNLQTPTSATFTPKLKLPKEASPEAK